MNPNFGNPAIGSLSDLTAGELFTGIIKTVINIGILVGMVAFLFLFIWGGTIWISSGGDKSQIEDARQKIKNALIGTFVLLSLFAIIKTIEILFGVNITGFNLGSLKIQ